MERLIRCSPEVTLCIDEFGRPGDPLVVQLEGHMAQLIATPASYCEALADQGFQVIRVDNRDVGRSSRTEQPYTLIDMAADIHGLLATLGRPAVICGRSMGGAIAQILALHHPEDVLGLGLFFSFAKRDQWPNQVLRSAPFTDEASFIAWELEMLPEIAGPDYPFAEGDIEQLAKTMWVRGVDWAGCERQRLAMAATEPWARSLSGVNVPVSIVHGAQDPVIPVAGAHHLAQLLPQARLDIVEGLGHQQPAELDDRFLAATLAVC